MNNKFNMYSSEYIMSTHLQPLEFFIDKMLCKGLYILAGAPKIGKSWLALDMCLSVAEGTEFLKRKTVKGKVLYLSLEDSLIRIQNRLYEITDEPSDNLDFVITADTIGNGLEQQIENSKRSSPELKIVVIDTLQMVRGNTDATYGSDYKELSSLKALADKLCIAIVLIHHTRKNYDSDPFNMISGTTGLSGCVDGSMVLMEKKRGSREAKLYCVGRDIENIELNLVFENSRWKVTDALEESKPDIFSFAVHDFLMERKSFRGTATELSRELKLRFGDEFFPNRVSRDLVQNSHKLKLYGVEFSLKRSHGKRSIELDYNREGDSSDGTLLWVEIVDVNGTHENTSPFTEPIVVMEDTNSGDGNSETGDSNRDLGDGRNVILQLTE